MSDDVHVKIDSSKSFKYSELNDDESSIFYKRGATTIFIAASCIGFYFRQRVNLPSGKNSSDLFITSTLGGENQTRLWILKSIAISEIGIDSLTDLKATMKICQEYANYGIDYLYQIHSNTDDETLELSKIMNDILEEEFDT